MKTKSGIRIEEVEPGSGNLATPDSWVLVEVRFFLNRGEEVDPFRVHPEHKFVINLGSRDYFPGLRQGIRNSPSRSEAHIVKYEDAWADMAEPAGNIARERSTNRLCLRVSYYQENSQPLSYYVREGDPEFKHTRAFRLISTLLERPELR